jgi:hypothetical protein
MKNLFGQERALTTPDGRAWTLGRLELRLIRSFGEWVKKREGDPFAVIDRYLGKISDDKLMPFFKEARDTQAQLCAFSLATPVASKHLATEEGIAELYRLLLSSHHPKVTSEEALYVALNDEATLAEAIQTAEGSPAKNAVAVAG